MVGIARFGIAQSNWVVWTLTGQFFNVVTVQAAFRAGVCVDLSFEKKMEQHDDNIMSIRSEWEVMEEILDISVLNFYNILVKLVLVGYGELNCNR
ncbi:hypothetical protein evm_003433 [Chilo suppressalis]|nr:hypothetical protein evm_003433 [Chilo suppressalis]